MSTDSTHSKPLSEFEFLDRYLDSTLRKPQVVADSILRTMVLAVSHERALLCAALAEQLGEACRRLAHVFSALEDRTHSVAKVLAGPLPPSEAWIEFAQLVATVPPEALARRMFIDEAAADYAERLRGSDGFEIMSEAVRAHERNEPILLKARAEGGRLPDAFAYGGLRLGATEADGAMLADVIADVCWTARGFLESYTDARRGGLN